MGVGELNSTDGEDSRDGEAGGAGKMLASGGPPSRPARAQSGKAASQVSSVL